MSKKLLISFLAIFLIFSSYVTVSNASTEEKKQNIDLLQELTKRLYKSVKLGDYVKSKLLIEEISNLAPSIKYKDLTTVEGMEAISSAIIQTKNSLASLRPKQNIILNNATQLYLAIDALSHKDQPLWHRYYSVLQQDIEKIRKAVKTEDSNQIQLAVQNFLSHYNLIKPAILVSNPPYMVEKIDSLVTAIVRQTDAQNRENVLNQLKGTLHELFYGDDKETIGIIGTDTIIWNTLIGMGLIIFIVLSYVIWRKYQGTYLS
ncbi:hypothetical protein BHF71_10185 [Vulcanibacillus modesticaldus]|uniref:Sporulation protein YpjB n=1 Tax=Vulcanibacillus modesticaldus TaxID=337097 RepID=A0A1D2YTL3_9BACI|nr:sporulation protein YpjB [Vulcanibacillus modesticaldus]OEF99019.1 hypothetical protein BHF71_10185 [Vulcanibacillus modesticaldus]